MLRLDQIKLNPDQPETVLRSRAAKLLRLPENQILSCRVLRRAVDAREDVSLVYALAVEVRDEKQILRKCRDRRISAYEPENYVLPASVTPPAVPPVVTGAGPAGLFAALTLALCGAAPILLERGQPVERRIRDVESFWSGNPLDAESNVQFGEGGAGAFSDGKLNTGTRDLRHRWILEQLAACGAPESILTDAKPHVGTDYLHLTLRNLRRALLDAGAEIRFGHRLDGIRTENGRLAAVSVTGPDGLYELPCRQLVLAPGHSARDTFSMLYDAGAAMEQKPFAVGVRIEHRQSDMDAVQYRSYAGHPGLGAASYKLSCHLPGGRSAFSFCVCPGGKVVAASSETDQVVTNGMSEYARDAENINGALLINVTPADFGSGHPLAGVSFQRKLERAAFDLGGGDYRAPCQRVGDFLARRPSTGPGTVRPSYRPGVFYTDLHLCLPPFVARSIEEALPLLEERLRGYAHPDALLTAVESRSSSPVRIIRDESGQSNLRGLYPCGEGAGYAGGILSAAADGMHAAERILKSILEEQE